MVWLKSRIKILFYLISYSYIINTKDCTRLEDAGMDHKKFTKRTHGI